MKRLARPPCPAALLIHGRAEAERARKHFEEDGLIADFPFEAYSLREVKDALASMSSGRCAYCEGFYESTSPQDVEHFRPKGRVDAPTGKLRPGYWWLASDWDNLLPSCIMCNRPNSHRFPDGVIRTTGKADRFPLADEAQRARTRGLEGAELPLLIDPSREEPDRLIRFVAIHGESIAVPVSEDRESIEARRARTSIDIYGLNRPSLVIERTRNLKLIQLSIRIVERLVRDLEEANPIEAAEIEELLIDELTKIRAHVSGREGYSAALKPFVLPFFERLGLSL